MVRLTCAVDAAAQGGTVGACTVDVAAGITLINGLAADPYAVDRGAGARLKIEGGGNMRDGGGLDGGLAEGLTAENYLDTGDRDTFENGGAVLRLHPQFAIRTWEAAGCAPLVVTGPEVERTRALIAARRARAARRRARRRVA
ncbi:MAG TPA: hypothetical protein VJY39_16770 [Acidisphaera sp.]|nr:hypothetical protein [Acidisphaera sp.]